MVAKEAFYIYDFPYLQVNVCNILNLRFTNAKKRLVSHARQQIQVLSRKNQYSESSTYLWLLEFQQRKTHFEQRLYLRKNRKAPKLVETRSDTNRKNIDSSVSIQNKEI